jgi:hypothetical protein
MVWRLAQEEKSGAFIPDKIESFKTNSTISVIFATVYFFVTYELTQ